MGSFEGCSSEEQKFIDGQGNTKLLLTTTDQKKCDAIVRAARQNANLAMPDARVAARRHIPRSARPQTRSARQICSRVLARCDVEALLRRNDALPAERSVAAAKRIFRAQLANGRRYAPRRRAVPGRHRHAAGIYILPGFSLHDELALLVGGRLHAPGGPPSRHPQPGAVFRPESTWAPSPKASWPTWSCSTPTRWPTSTTPRRSPPSSPTATSITAPRSTPSS